MEYLELGYSDPVVDNLSLRFCGVSTQCMRKAAPYLVGNRNCDLVIRSPSGSGKSVTVLSSLIYSCARDKQHFKSNGAYAIVVAPSMDSAVQLLMETYKLAKGTGVRVGYAVKYQGNNLNNLMNECDIIIGTIDVLPKLTFKKKKIYIDNLRYLAVFNADEVESHHKFVSYYEKLLGSMYDNEFFVIAVSSKKDYQCQLDLSSPFTVDCEYDLTLQDISHSFIDVSLGEEDGAKKIDYLTYFLGDQFKRAKKRHLRIVIFVNDARTANFVTISLLEDYKAFLIHAERTDEECAKTYERFVAGDLDILVCTDMLDSKLEFTVDFAINYDLPVEPQHFLRFVQRFKQIKPAKNTVKVLSFFHPIENAEIAYPIEKFLLYFDASVPEFVTDAYKSDNARFIQEVSTLDSSLAQFDQ